MNTVKNREEMHGKYNVVILSVKIKLGCPWRICFHGTR